MPSIATNLGNMRSAQTTFPYRPHIIPHHSNPSSPHRRGQQRTQADAIPVAVIHGMTTRLTSSIRHGIWPHMRKLLAIPQEGGEDTTAVVYFCGKRFNYLQNHHRIRCFAVNPSIAPSRLQIEIPVWRDGLLPCLVSENLVSQAVKYPSSQVPRSILAFSGMPSSNDDVAPYYSVSKLLMSPSQAIFSPVRFLPLKVREKMKKKINPWLDDYVLPHQSSADQPTTLLRKSNSSNENIRYSRIYIIALSSPRILTIWDTCVIETELTVQVVRDWIKRTQGSKLIILTITCLSWALINDSFKCKANQSTRSTADDQSPDVLENKGVHFNFIHRTMTLSVRYSLSISRSWIAAAHNNT
ncbi:hypothetical protein SERLADRAFT_443198 [Serpula lacrymans var. lacrymans S7.9]|uniref:Uncharacterized protein n=1 Tax=Serpula lacrymans var. lacrymans (strain S7.9) TaxID=578457 RepID=F8PBV2_SERL9|nr:uncharacterized protein SERLADRAFT_443198 [Serpula lacrymans var. lacrymans S7.9]EGO19155.1 hypothetical protein SERLADRAFT_443198 [Serpula lacrymans var. lacrymans S7.9]